MGHLADYFDYDAYARDLFMYDYYYETATFSATIKTVSITTKGSPQRRLLW